MKHLLLVALTLLLGLGQLKAEEHTVVFDFKTNSYGLTRGDSNNFIPDNTSISEGEVTITFLKDDNSSSANTSRLWTNGMRIFGGGKMLITLPDQGLITEITPVVSSGTLSNLIFTDPDNTLNTSSGSWHNSASTVAITTSFTGSGNVEMSSLTIKYESSLTPSEIEIPFPGIMASNQTSLEMGLSQIKNPYNLPLHFVSDDPEIVSVEEGDNGDRLILGEKEGNATITASFSPSSSYPYASWEGSFVVMHSDYREIPEFHFDTDAVSATIGKDDFIAPVLTCPENILPEEIVWSSSDPSIAYTEDGINYTFGKVPGEAVITANFPGNPGYKPAEASFTLNLLTGPGALTIKTVTFDFKNNDYGLTRYTSGNLYMEDGTQASLEDITLTFDHDPAANASDNPCRLYSDGMRAYKAGRITISCPFDILEVKAEKGNSATPSLSISDGETSVASNWTGSSKEVYITTTLSSSSTTIETLTISYIYIPEPGFSFTTDYIEVTDQTAADFDPLAYFDNPNGIDLAEITFSSEHHHIVGIDAATGRPYFEGDAYGETVLTATFPGNDSFLPGTASMTVNYNDPRTAPEFYFETTHIDAELDDIYEMPKLIHSDFISSDEIKWVCSNDNILTFDPADGTILTGSVKGTAVITAYYEGNDQYAAASAYFSVTVGQVASTEVYNLVTSLDQLQDGSKVIIASRDSNAVAGGLSGEILTKVDQSSWASSDKNSFSVTNDLAELFTLSVNEDGKYAFQFENGQYLNSTTAKKMTSVVAPAYASVTFTGSNANITYGSNLKLQYNSASPRFTTYTSSQTAIQLFVLETITGKEEVTIAGNSVKTLDEATGLYTVSEEETPRTPTNTGILVHLQGLPDGYAIDHAQVTFVDVTNEANVHTPDVPLAFHEGGYFEIDYPYGMPSGRYEMQILLPETDFYMGIEAPIVIPVEVYMDRETREALFLIEGALELKGHHTHLFQTNDDHHVFRLPEVHDGITVHYMVTPATGNSGVRRVRRAADSPVGHSVYDHESGIVIPRTASEGTISLVAEQNGVQAPAVALAYSGLPMEEGIYFIGSFSNFEVNSNAIRLTLDENGVYTGYYKPAEIPTEPIQVCFANAIWYNPPLMVGPRAVASDDMYSTQSDITVTGSDIPAGAYWEGLCGINDARWIIEPSVFDQLGDVGLKVAININSAVVGFGGEFMTAVDSIEAVDTDALYFTLQGVRVERPADGIYIRVKDGRAAKVRF